MRATHEAKTRSIPFRFKFFAIFFRSRSAGGGVRDRWFELV
jgi:hypothetical protein